MGHKFEPCRIELQPDGSAYIGLTIIATVGQSDMPDTDYAPSAQWRYCRVAHAHDWDVCDVKGLFMAREKDAEGKDIAGTSAEDQLIAWLQARRDEKTKNVPRQISAPKRKVQKVVDGKTVEVDEPISISLSRKP